MSDRSRTLKRRAIKFLDGLVRIALSVVLSGALGAAQAVAAEVVAVEVVANVPNSVIVVPQGHSVEFSIQVSATGNLHNSITMTKPATARVANRFVITGGAVVAAGHSDPLAFWCSKVNVPGAATWVGAPDPYRVTAVAEAPPGTPVGDYTGTISMIVNNPLDVTPELDNNTRDLLTIRVVPGDTTPPTSRATVVGPEGENGWYLGDVEVWLSAEDNPGGSGVDRIEWSLDGGVTWRVGEHVVISGEGTHVLSHRAFDRIGNCEPVQQTVVRIDMNDPAIGITGVADGDCVRSAEITVAATDTAAGSGIRSILALLDGEPFSGGAVDEEGVHELVVDAADAAGRRARQSVRFTIDRSAPQITIASPIDGSAYREPPAFDFSVEDESGVVRCDSSHPKGHVFSDEGEHSAWVEAEDRAGNVARAAVEFLVDLKPPQSQAKLAGALGENGWYTSPVEVTLDAVDPAAEGVKPSGVDRIEYRVGGGAWMRYEGPLVLSGDGEHDVEHRAIDRAGNEEETQSVHIKIDRSAPTASLSLDGVNGDGGWWTSLVSVSASGDDAMSGFAYAELSFDGSTWTRADRIFFLDEGSHEVHARAYDFAGNVSETLSQHVRIDRTAPVTECSLSGDAGDDGWFTGVVHVTLSATDAVSGVVATEYSLDGVTWQEYAGPFAVSAPGITAIYYRSRDAAGNLESAKPCTVCIDLDDPVISISGVSDGDWVPFATIEYEAMDPEPGSGVMTVDATVDGEPFASGETVETEGDHVLAVVARDASGRTARSEVRFTIDRTAPVITIEEPDDGSANNAPVTLRFTIFDLDPFVAHESSHENGSLFESEGAYEVEISAQDRAGNRSRRSCSFMIDLTAPSVRCELEGVLGRDSWWMSPVTAHLVAEDVVSGGVASGGVRTFWRLGGAGEWTEGDEVFVGDEGVHLLEYFARDRAGNDSAVERCMVRVDIADPIISISAPTERTYLYGETVTVRFAVSDTASGVRAWAATLNGAPVANGEDVRLTTPGINVLMVTAEDGSGRTSVERVEFRVAFQPGVILPPGSFGHTWNAGRMMPVKFTVLDAHGRRTDAARAVVEVWQAGSLLCSGIAQVQYDCVSGQPFYQFNAKTLKDRPGKLDVIVTLDDGVTIMRQTMLLR